MESETALTTTQAAELVTLAGLLDRNPAVVFIAEKAPGSRRTIRESLNAIAALLTGGQADALTLNWAALRFQHTAAIRAAMA